MNRWRRWLVCVAFTYPAYWVAQFVLNALPALIRIPLLGYRLTYFRIDFLRVAAAASPTNPVELSSGPALDPPAFWQAALLVIVVVVLLGVVSRRGRLLAGLAVAMIGSAGLQGPTFRIFSQRTPSADVALTFFFFFGVALLGLRWMLAGSAPGGYVARAAFLLASFSLPLLGLWAVFAWGFQFRTARFFWVMIPGALATLLASVRPQLTQPDEALQPGWKAVAAGTACTLLLMVGIASGGPRLNRTMREAELAVGRAAMETLPKIPVGLPYERIFFQKGVNYTAEFPAVYTSEAARELLKMLPSYGVNSIALVPYGGTTRNPPTVRFYSRTDSWESDEGLEQLSRVAHAIGVKVLLKPQVWTRGGDWIELDFPDSSDRAKWFADYQVFLEHYARLATRLHADVFCIGVELGKLTHDDAEWRKLIARVRVLYPGPLVYAANFGSEFESITFWDALDYIGLDNYYPLPDDFSTDALVRKVEAVQRKFERPVIFTEAGFASREATHRQPWEDGSGSLSPEEQARCYEAVFSAFYSKPWFKGVYWWKVGTNGRGGPQDSSHSPWRKPAMEVLRRWYVQAGR
jgi:hypothetical protein